MQLTVQRCKTFERLVKERLVPSSSVLEPMANGDLTKFQRGFRKQRSTTDQLVQLEFYTKNLCAPRTRRDHLTVFVDQKKAYECYDTMWKNGILRDLFIMPAMQGQLPQLILKFAPDRQFRVRVGSCLSDAYSQEMGVQQGT